VEFARRSDRASAVVEAAFVLPVLGLLLFGIVTFGYMMSFKQNLTEAATEGARAGAVATSDPTSAAGAAMGNAAATFDQTCGSGGLTCVATIADCPTQPTPAPPTPVQCVTSTVSYDYAHHPLLPVVPLLGALLPRTLSSMASAQVNS
jgi:Flp pilus assembly protein TadG